MYKNMTGQKNICIRSMAEYGNNAEYRHLPRPTVIFCT